MLAHRVVVVHEHAQAPAAAGGVPLQHLEVAVAVAGRGNRPLADDLCDRDRLAALLKEASRANVLGQIFAIREDVLGVYRFNPPKQPSWGDTDDANARIELFWGVIGLVSRLLGVSLEGLTVKVLAHELAHAYTHVGADADGRAGWAASSTARASCSHQWCGPKPALPTTR